jgi:flagellar M-ring protein FliF
MADAPTPTPKPALQQLGDQAQQLWKKLPGRGRFALFATVVVVLGGVALLMLRGGGGSWSPLIEKISPEDAVELGAALDGRGIPHRFAGDGTTIEVPSDRAAEARVVATAAGLPHTGTGFEVFDHVSLGQSSFAEQVNYRRALQGELARSITTLVEVEGARVHLALGRRSLMKDADEPPSASVALRLRPGQHLGADQVRGVKQLVAASVEGLKPDAVVVIDDHGDLLDGEAKDGAAASTTMEQEISGRVRSILERVVGAGHVAVVATAEVDPSKVTQTEELYDKDKTALRSEALTYQGTGPGPTVGGVAGVRGNLPGAPAPTAGGTAGGNDGVTQETRNFEVSHTVRQTESPGARVQRLHLAILVDEKVEKDGKVVPRTKDELDQLSALAREAAGLDEARGDHLEIRAVRFAPDEDLPAPAAVAAGGELPWTYVAVGGGVLLLLVIGGVVFALSRRRRTEEMPQALALPAPVAELERLLAMSASPPALPASRPAHERVLDTIRGDVPRAARVLSTWLAQAKEKA